MELTINQIKIKQKELKTNLNEVLNKFNQETGLKVTGEICFGDTDKKDQQFVFLKYSNPFR